MGEAASLIKAFSCEACAKYVLNSCHFHSQCMHECCVIDFTTDEIEIEDENSDIEVEIEGCCIARKHA